MSDYSKLTLGELLSSEDETIRRNAVAILKQSQKNDGYKLGRKHLIEDVRKWLDDFRKTQPHNLDIDESTFEGAAFYFFIRFLNLYN